MKHKRIMVIGDGVHAPYHPLSGVDESLKALFGGENTVECSVDYDSFLYENLKNYDLCISYVDCWSGAESSPDALSDAQTAGILQFVAAGGGLLNLHTGIAYQSRYELAQLAGAYFTGHPPMEEISYHAFAGTEHPVLEGFQEFSLKEEPYQFEFKYHTPVQILLEYEYRGERYPAAWTTQYGMGRTAYLQPGHMPENVGEAHVQALLLRFAQWLCGCEGK